MLALLLAQCLYSNISVSTFTFNEFSYIYSIMIDQKNLNYISFEFYSEIPETDNPVETEKIEISLFNKKFEFLEKQKLSVEIIRPIVKLRVQNEELTPNKGFFKIETIILKGFVVEIPGINIEVTDELGNIVPIETSEKDLTELDQDLTVGVKLDNLIGKFVIRGEGVFKFHFKIPYIDANKNRYWSNEEIIELEKVKEYTCNLDYIYNYTKPVAATS